MYNRSGLANYAEGGVVPEEIGTDAVGDLFTSIQRPPITRRYFTPPIQQADGTYGNTGYDPTLAPRTIGQTQYYNPTVPPMRTPMRTPMPMPMPGDEVMPPEFYDVRPPEFYDVRPMPGERLPNGMPDWMIAPPEGSMNTMALVEHTNPVTGEKFTAPNGGYSINPAYIESQLNNAYTENLGRDIGAPGLEFYQDQLNKNTQDASTGKSFDQIVADLDYSGEGKAYVSPAETEAARLQAQTDNLMSAYQSNLGRDIGSEGLSFYSNQLDQYNADPSTGKSMQQIMADLAFSKEGQAYTPPMMPTFGSNGGGNAYDDNEQIKAMNTLLDKNRAARLKMRIPPHPDVSPYNMAYENNDQGNLMNVFTGIGDRFQTFGEDLSTGINNYIESDGGIGSAFTKGLNNIFGGGNGADDAKQVAQAQANANAAAANSVQATNAGGIFDYGIGGLVK